MRGGRRRERGGGGREKKNKAAAVVAAVDRSKSKTDKFDASPSNCSGFRSTVSKGTARIGCGFSTKNQEQIATAKGFFPAAFFFFRV